MKRRTVQILRCIFSPRVPLCAVWLGVIMFSTPAGRALAANETQQKQMARRAAIADAQRQLLELVQGVEIDSETTVRDYLTGHDEIRSSVEGEVHGAEVVETRYLADGSCEVDLELPVRRLTRALRKNFEYPDETLSVTGVGVMPAGGGEPVAAAEARDAWYAQTVTATGVSVPPASKAGTAQGRLLALRGAHVEAQRNLMEKVLGVRIDARTVVRDFIGDSDVIRSELQGYMRGARRIASRDLPDGAVEVDVEINLRGVRKIIYLHQNRYAEIVR